MHFLRTLGCSATCALLSVSAVAQTWTQLSPTTTPLNRWHPQFVTDTRRQRIVMFGGRSPSLTATANDTWAWDGSDWAQVFPAVSPSGRAFYGAGCAGGAGIPVLQAPSAPRLGQIFQVDLVSLSPIAVPFLVVGYGNTDWATIPLPLDLGLFGFNGCALEVAIDAALQLPNFAGAATLQIPIPAFSATLNAQIWLQGLMLDPLAANAAISMSNAAHTVVGS